MLETASTAAAGVDRRSAWLDAAPAPGPAPRPGLAWIPGGQFAMGSDRHYPEEAPAHPVRVSGFWMAATVVTNAEFARFVDATGYVTLAERDPDPALYPGAIPGMLVPGGMVFFKPPGRVDLRDIGNWWAYVGGADWKHPRGPGSSLAGLDDHPVVQVVHEDALAYARWAGLELPTEAEWEFAARGGLDGADYVWGADFMPDGAPMANTWHGEFPWQRLPPSLAGGTMPVRAFAPNGYGLYQMAGNVWEWTTDWYRARHPEAAHKACCVPLNPRGGALDGSYAAGQPDDLPRIGRKTIKGGSHLCAPNYCRRYRPAARYPHPIDTGTCHLGFRCILRA